MKLIIPFVVALAFVSLAIAQEQSPSPSTEQSASAVVQESPAEAVKSSPAATASAAESPAGKKKESAPAASPAANAAAQKTTTAAKPGKKMSAEATLKDNENRWEAAVAAHDSSVAQSMLANDFAGVYWDGTVMSKSDYIGTTKKDKDTYKSAVNERLEVHSYGPNVAVVIGTAREKGTGKNGKAFDHVYRFTDTWVARGGQWQCVASQEIRVK